MTYLIDVPVEFFNKVRIEIEGKFSFDIIPIDEVEDGIGKLIPQFFSIEHSKLIDEVGVCGEAGFIFLQDRERHGIVYQF